MLSGRAVAVLTLDDRMRGHGYAFLFFRVAGCAVVWALIFDGYLFPIPDIVCPVPAVHIPPLMDPETLGDINGSGEQYKGDETEYYPERSENMGFHRFPSRSVLLLIIPEFQERGQTFCLPPNLWYSRFMKTSQLRV